MRATTDVHTDRTGTGGETHADLPVGRPEAAPDGELPRDGPLKASLVPPALSGRPRIEGQAESPPPRQVKGRAKLNAIRGQPGQPTAPGQPSGRQRQ